MMTLGLRAKALEAQNKSLTQRGSPDVRILRATQASILKSGDPLWVRDLFWASGALARNVITRGAASTKLILLAYGKRIRSLMLITRWDRRI